MIEMVVALPILLVLLMSIIDFGFYGVKKLILSSATTAITKAIQNNPGISEQSLINIKNAEGRGIINMNQVSLIIRSKTSAYSPDELKVLNDPNWIWTHPDGGTGAYYVGVRFEYWHTWLSPITKVTLGSNAKQIISTGQVRIGTYFDGCPAGQEVVSRGNRTFACRQPIIPDCSAGQSIFWNGSTFQCYNLPNCNSDQVFSSSGGQIQCRNKTESCRNIDETNNAKGGTTWQAAAKSCNQNGEYIKYIDISRYGSGGFENQNNCDGDGNSRQDTHVVTGIRGGGSDQPLVCQYHVMQVKYQCCKYE